MSETTPNMPDNVDVDMAFDPELRQAKQDMAEYMASRPYKDENGDVHDPGNDDLIDSDRYFDDKRQSHEDDSREAEAYEDMSVSQLARKMGEADFYGDKGSSEHIHKLLESKLDYMDYELHSDRGDTTTHSTRKENDSDGKTDNDVRKGNLWKRVMTIRDREVSRLSGQDSEPEPAPAPEPAPNGGESADDNKEVKPAKQEDENSKATDDSSEEQPTEPLDQETVKQEQPHSFQEGLADLVEKLKDERFVPSSEQYDNMVKLAEQIDLRHLDPKKDKQSGMGYFIKGSEARLNPYQARTLLDKVRVVEWVPSQSEEPVIDAVLKESDPQQVMDITTEASERRALITIMDYSHFVEMDKDPSDPDNLAAYKSYLHGRTVLTHHIYEQYRDKVDDVEYYPLTYVSEAIRDFRKETEAGSKQYRRIALRGLKAVIGKARALKEKRQSRKNQAKDQAKDQTEKEKPEESHEEATEQPAAEEATEEREV